MGIPGEVGARQMGIKREACDDWFSKCIRLAAGWSCEHTGQHFGEGNPGLHCAHIHGRRKKSVRWDPDNAVSLSAASHRYFTENPTEFTHWLEQTLGHGHIELLRDKANQTFKTTKAIRKEIAAHYRSEYRRMQEQGTTDLVGY